MELGQLIHESQPWPFPQELSTSGASLALNLEGSTIEGIFRGGGSDLPFMQGKSNIANQACRLWQWRGE